MRAFVAVRLDEPARAALGAAIGRLRAAAPHVAWVPPENLHLTLKFLGNVETGALEAVAGALAAAVGAVRPFDFDVRGLGAFPTALRARVVWAGAAGGREAMAEVASRVERALAPLGFPSEARGFSPHVTLGRAREPRKDARLSALIEAGAGLGFGVVRVAAVSLMRSDLSPRGAHYAEIASAPLGA